MFILGKKLLSANQKRADEKSSGNDSEDRFTFTGSKPFRTLELGCLAALNERLTDGGNKAKIREGRVSSHHRLNTRLLQRV